MTNFQEKRFLLLIPDKSLLNLFQGKYNKRTYLNKLRWPLRTIFYAIPMAILFILATIAVGLFWLIFALPKGKNAFGGKMNQFMDFVNRITPSKKEREEKTEIDEDTLAFFQACKRMQMHTVMYVQLEQIKLLKQCTVLKEKGYIDEIWQYEDSNDLLEQCKASAANLENSFIAGYEVLRENKKWHTSLHSGGKNSFSLHRISDVLHLEWENIEYKNKFRSFKQVAETNTFNRIYLQPNTFLTHQMVVFLDSEHYPKVNEYVDTHYESIQLTLKERGYSFIYLNKISLASDNHFLSELINYLNYKFPALFEDVEESPESVLTQLFHAFNENDFTQLLKDALKIPDFDCPVIIRNIETDSDKSFRDGYLTCSLFFLKENEHTEAGNLFQNYYSKLGTPKGEVYLQLRDTSGTEYDADDHFYPDGNQISPEIKAAITLLNAMNSEKMVLASLQFLIDSVRTSRPSMYAKLNSQLLKNLSSDSAVKISRLVIDDQYRIWLPDYHNLEIKMSPLPKTFFFFMLKHPEGLQFKELNQHKDELISIYSKVGNRIEMDQIKSSINDLVNVRSNSVNEKCSRIKEAFISKIDDSLAKHYYVNGGRQNVKQITLDRSLLHFNQTF